MAHLSMLPDPPYQHMLDAIIACGLIIDHIGIHELVKLAATWKVFLHACVLACKRLELGRQLYLIIFPKIIKVI